MTDERGLPANVDAERTILGAMLMDNGYMSQLAMLEVEDFALQSNRTIFFHMRDMAEYGFSIDIVTLSDSLRNENELESVGGSPYLFSLTEGLPRRPAIKDYVRIVKAKSLQRQLIVACETALDSAYGGVSGFQIIATLRARMDEIETAARGKKA